MVLVLASALLAYGTAERAFRTSQAADRSQEVLRTLNLVLAEAERSETMQRGYLLTGQRSYKVNAERAKRALQNDLQRLSDRVAGDSLQSLAAARVIALANRRAELLREVVRVFERGGLDLASESLVGGEGQAVMDSLRTVLAGMYATERRALGRRAGWETEQREQARIVFILTAGLSLLLLGLGAAIIHRDLGRQQRTEQHLRDALIAADAANRAKTEFLATVSHEIRTPLNAVLGMAELLRESRLSSEQDEFARTIQSNAESLVSMVGDLLDSFKIDAGQVDLESIPFNLREIVYGVGEMLMVRAEAKDLDFSVSVAPEIPASVIGDPNRIRQILVNLASNAIKFTEMGAVAIQAVVVRSGVDRLDVEITVADTGIGLSPADRERVFRPFVQAEASTTRRFGGTGLGLSISRSLAELMSGTISVESDEGRGSVFRLVLPFSLADSAPLPRPDLSGVNALLLTENQARAEGIERSLTAAGARVTVTAAAPDAVALATEQSFDVMLLDDRMPNCHGIVRHFHAVAGANTAVVALCSLSSKYVGETGPGREVTDCIFKPIREDRLLAAVRSAAQRSPADFDESHSIEREAVPPARRWTRILVAEDNDDNWTVVSGALRGAGYGVERAENGSIAVELVSQAAYDLILMDVEMPVLDGFDATTRIRALEREQGREGVPIVALTAHAMRGFRERCLQSGMNDYATKPITQGQLLVIAQEWIDPRPLILVADDSPEVRQVIAHYLPAAEFRMVGVADGSAVVPALERHRVAALLLDMEMPGQDGYTTVRALRGTSRWRHLPVLAITGHTGAAQRRKCLEAGCTGYVAKPIRRPELLKALRSALREPSAGEPAAPSPAAESDRGSRETIALVRPLVTRVARMVGRHRFDDALLLASEILRALGSVGEVRATRIARELEGALQDGDQRSTTFWVGRLQAELHEAMRIEALRDTGLLDSEPEEAFDRLTRELVVRLNVPTAVVSFVNAERQFFKSFVGIPEDIAEARETPLSHSFCQHVVARAEPFIVSDARAHPIVRDNLAIPDLGVIAYAGVPLRTADGYVLGSLCAIDSKPREWSPQDLAVLEELAESAERTIQQRARDPVSFEPTPAASTSFERADPILETLAARFVESRYNEVRDVSGLIAKGELAEVRRLGHQLKGSAATFGYPDIGRLGARMEVAAAQQDLEQVRVIASDLEAAFEAARSNADKNTSS